jgi:hypothetical protein
MGRESCWQIFLQLGVSKRDAVKRKKVGSVGTAYSDLRFRRSCLTG